MKNKLLLLFLSVAMIFNLVGCAKCILIEYKDVEVSIVDEYYQATWLQPIRAGKVTTWITHPSIHKITVEYNGVEYVLNDKETYDKYKDKIGHSTIGQLEIKTYDNGSISYDILSLE